MKYKIRCNKCGRDFAIVAQREGMVRSVCPHCGHVITCSVGSPAPQKQSVTTGVRQRVAHAATRIGDFQKSRSNGDLIVFFSFSLLFVLLVIGGLFVAAEVTRLIVSGKSWLFHAYLNYIYS